MISQKLHVKVITNDYTGERNDDDDNDNSCDDYDDDDNDGSCDDDIDNDNVCADGA